MNRQAIPLVSKGTWILILLMALGGLSMIYRFSMGLGAATNLNDSYPWGLWVAVDVLVGVALAAGGFTITAAVYIFNMKKYRPVVRPAILTALIGYLMVIVGLMIDIGKPLTFWHPLFMWQHHSIMFEVVLCITLYTSVLVLEFAPPLLDGIGMKLLARFMRKKWIVFPLVIAGITLSYLHQSSLGAFYLIVPEKLHHLWYTPMIPQLFYLSSIAAGLAMVSFESIVSSWAFKRGHENEILVGLAKGTVWTLLIYLVVRLTDLGARGNLPQLYDWNRPAILFYIELFGGVVFPMILLEIGRRRGALSVIFLGQVLVMLGVVLNRFNANFLAQISHGGSYFPSWMEIAITLGLISLGVFLYRVAVLRLEVFPHVEIQQ